MVHFVGLLDTKQDNFESQNKWTFSSRSISTLVEDDLESCLSSMEDRSSSSINDLNCPNSEKPRQADPFALDKALGVFNKVTQENLYPMLGDLAAISWDLRDRLEELVDCVFKSVAKSPCYRLEFALLCTHLGQLSAKQSNDTFKSLLSRRCQKQFEACLESLMNIEIETVELREKAMQTPVTVIR